MLLYWQSSSYPCVSLVLHLPLNALLKITTKLGLTVTMSPCSAHQQRCINVKKKKETKRRTRSGQGKRNKERITRSVRGKGKKENRETRKEEQEAKGKRRLVHSRFFTFLNKYGSWVVHPSPFFRTLYLQLMDPAIFVYFYLYIVGLFYVLL